MQGPRIEHQINPRFVPDDIPVWLGNNKDSALIFDNANDEWTVQTKNAAGTLTDRLRIKANTNTPSPDLVDNPLKWTVGRAVTAADYSIGRDLDATNQLHLNVPTGAAFELSVNDTPEFVVSATQIDLKSNDLINVNSATITGATGNVLVVKTNVLVVDATNNRVGILTPTPVQVALDVRGKIRSYMSGTVGQNAGNLFGRSLSVIAGDPAVTIQPDTGSEASLYIIAGQEAANRFADIVIAHNTAPVVVSSNTSGGTPGARTYSRSGTNLLLAIAGTGTYTVYLTGIGGSEA
jgi:hypothetical protein